MASIFENYESLLINCADSSRDAVSGTLQDGSIWLKGSLDTLSHKEYPVLNQEFVEYISFSIDF